MDRPTAVVPGAHPSTGDVVLVEITGVYELAGVPVYTLRVLRPL